MRATELTLETVEAGDPDLTFNGDHYRPELDFCQSPDKENNPDGFICTRRDDGHKRHVAGDSQFICAVWESE